MKILVDDQTWQSAINAHSHHQAYYLDMAIPTDALFQYCQAEKIDCIICSTYQRILSHLHLNDQKLKLLPWVIPSQQACLMEDKFYGYHWFKQHQYTQYLPAQKELTDFPYLLKLPGNLSGKGVFYINNQSDFEKHIPLPKHYLTQDYIHTPYEYVYHFLAHQGSVLEEVCYQHDFNEAYNESPYYIRGYRIRNDVSIKIDIDSSHRALFHQIIQALEFTGLGCFDFKLNEERLYILEMNSRMGGSLIFYPSHVGDFDRFLKTYIKLIRQTSSEE